MASEFAKTLATRLSPLLKKYSFERDVRTTVDIALLEVSRAFGHAQHRNHDHSPGSCSACEQLEKVVGDLKIK
jgi:hypothetical protein